MPRLWREVFRKPGWDGCCREAAGARPPPESERRRRSTPGRAGSPARLSWPDHLLAPWSFPVSAAPCVAALTQPPFGLFRDRLSTNIDREAHCPALKAGPFLPWCHGPARWPTPTPGVAVAAAAAGPIRWPPRRARIRRAWLCEGRADRVDRPCCQVGREVFCRGEASFSAGAHPGPGRQGRPGPLAGRKGERIAPAGPHT
jgi:hypothetical protein